MSLSMSRETIHMPSLHITLPDDMKDFVELQASAAGFASADDYVAALVRQAREQSKIEELRELVLAADGRPVEMSNEQWGLARQRVLDHYRERLRQDLAVGIAQIDRGEYTVYEGERV